MADIKQKYGTAQALTVSSLNSLANQGIAVSDAVDNTTDLFVDVLVEVVIADVVEAGNKQVVVYAVSSVDGTNYGDTNDVKQMRRIGVVACAATGVSWRSAAMSLAAAFGGVVPPKWKVALFNDAGVSLAASGNSVQYRGVLYQSV